MKRGQSSSSMNISSVFLLKRNQQFFSPEYIKCINELKSICYAVEKS